MLQFSILEYEDMFPYTKSLKRLSAKNAYTLEQVKEILRYAEDLKLEVIPLIQTFGHMEFALKHKEFAEIRFNLKNKTQVGCILSTSFLGKCQEVLRHYALVKIPLWS